MERFEEILKKNKVTEDKAHLMRVYAELLLEENKKYNLTRITEPEDMAYFHFLDSISAADLIPKNAKVADIGTGGGFPGIPLKIMRQDIDMTLVDASHKKIEFIHSAAAELGITVAALAKRAEEMKEFRNTFDIVVSRAVSALNILCELCVPLLKIGGKLLAYKGADAQAEISQAENAVRLLGCALCGVYDMGIEGRKYVIVEIEKQSPTPKAYPRRFAKIKSNPL